VSLHSYRYAWAERAKTAGYPERYAQKALGHKSQAVHRTYARKARFELPSMEEYEQRHGNGRRSPNLGGAAATVPGVSAAQNASDTARPNKAG